MKYVITIILLSLLTSCVNGDRYIITAVKEADSNNQKYLYRADDNKSSTPFEFYSDSLYQVGDTLYLSKK